MNKINKLLSTFIFTFSCFVFLITLLIFPSEIFFATKTGLLLWYNNILPSVFAFIIGINIISASNFGKHSLHFSDNIFKKAFGIPPYCFKAMTLGHLAGYPLGSKLTSLLLKEKKIQTKDVTKSLVLSCACSPIFLISAIGVNIFNNKNIGYILILAQFISNIIISFFANYMSKLTNKLNKVDDICKDKSKNKSKDKNKSKNNLKSTQNSKSKNEAKNLANDIPSIISNSIMNAIETVISICGTIVFFCIIIKIVQIYKLDEHIFSLLNFLSTNIFKFDISHFKPILNTFIYGFIEITNGIYYLSTSGFSDVLKICIISFLTTFGGICVHMQLYNVFEYNGEIKPFDFISYLQLKIIAGFLSAMISYILFYIFLL